MGCIGWVIKKWSDLFGLIICYYNWRLLLEEDVVGVEYVFFEKLLVESDIISINVFFIVVIKYLIGEKEIS